MQSTCNLCGATGSAELFYATSMVRCKKCVNRISRERYQRLYKEPLKAARRAKDQAVKRKVVDLSDTDRAYAAGLIDGEGSIRITSRGKYGGTTFRHGQYTLMVEMVNTDKGMVDWMVERFGGTVSYTAESVAFNRKAKWHWRVASNKALYVLDAIWPYIRTKRKQTKLGRRFQRYAQYAGRAATLKIQALHERFYQEFSVLNKRGIRLSEVIL